MSKLKEMIKDENFIRLTVFISFNALVLYILSLRSIVFHDSYK